MERIKGILLILVSGISFGLMPILAKAAYAQGANSYSVLFLRFIFAALMLFCFIKIKKVSMALNKKQFFLILIFGVLGYSLCSITLFISYNYISVGLATMILFIHPAIVVILSLIIYKEKLYCRKIVSLIMASAGLYFLIGVKNTSLNVMGIILALLSAVFYSIYVLGISSSEVKKVNSYVMTFYFSVIAAVTMFILGYTSNNLNLNFSFVSFICILILALISTIIALMCFIEGVKIIGPSNGAIISTVEPIVSLVLGVVILKEPLTIQIILGSILIVLSVIFLIKDS